MAGMGRGLGVCRSIAERLGLKHRGFHSGHGNLQSLGQQRALCVNHSLSCSPRPQEGKEEVATAIAELLARGPNGEALEWNESQRCSACRCVSFWQGSCVHAWEMETQSELITGAAPGGAQRHCEGSPLTCAQRRQQGNYAKLSNGLFVVWSHAYEPLHVSHRQTDVHLLHFLHC